MKGETLGRALRLRGRKEITGVLQQGIRVPHQIITLFFCPERRGGLASSQEGELAAP
jgi:hypothetical protein